MNRFGNIENPWLDLKDRSIIIIGNKWEAVNRWTPLTKQTISMEAESISTVH